MKRFFTLSALLIIASSFTRHTPEFAAPTVSSVTIPAGNYKIGDNIVVTIATNSATCTVDAGTTINGVDVTASFASAGGNNYTLTYPVGAGNTDRASVGAIPINILIRDGAGGGNLNTYTTAPTSGGTVTIDANAPASFSIASVASTGNTLVANYYNSTNTAISVGVPIANDASLNGGTIKLRIQNTTNTGYVDVQNHTADAIAGGDVNTTKSISISSADLTASTGGGSTGYLNNSVIQVLAIITDKNGNSTTCTAASALGTDELNVDTTPPSNQNSIYTASTSKTGGGSVAITAGSASDNNWLAPSGTTTFTANGTTITTAAGNATSITAPTTAGSYNLFVIDAAGNYSSASTATLTVDNTAPTVSSIVLANSSPTNSTSVDYTVTFSENVNSVDVGDFTLTTGGSAAGSISNVNASSGTVFTVTVNTVSGTGTLRLDVKTSGGGATITDDAGNNFTAGYTGGSSYTIDNTSPTVSSIVLVTSSPTNATSVDYTVTFSENVNSVDVGDFVVTAGGTAAGTVSNVNASSGTVFTVTVNTVSGDGTLRLDVKTSGAGATITDDAGNSFTAGYTSGSSYTIDNTAPTSNVTSYTKTYIKTGTAQSIQITFSEALTVTPKITVTGPAGTIVNNQNMTGGPTVWTYAAGSTWTGDGTATVTVGSGKDAAGNTVTSTPTNNTFIVDNTAPSAVTVNQAGSQTDPAYGNTATFTVVFTNGPIDGATFAGSDFSVAAGTATYTMGTPSTSDGGVTWTVVATATTIGSVVPTVNTSTVSDLAGNVGGNHASTGADGTVTVVLDPTNPSSITPTAGSPANSTISLAKATPTSSRYFVVMKAGSAVTFVPSDGNTYSGFTPSLNFSSAADLGGGEKLVFYGTGGSFPLTITGLAPSTQYYFALYAENDSGGGANPNFAATAVTANLTTGACTYPNAPTTLTQTSNTSTVTVGLTRSTNVEEVLILFKSGGIPASTPVDGVDYTGIDNLAFGSAGTLGDAKVVYSGEPSAATTFTRTITGLTPGTTYGFAIYTYDPTTFCYKSTALTGTQATTTTYAAEMTVTSSATLTEPATISSMGTALSGAVGPQTNAVQNFDFTVTDAGGDGADGKISQIIFNQGPSNQIADWSQAISAARLIDNFGNSQTSNITINATNITVASISTTTLGLVPDGTPVIYTLTIALKTSLGGTLPSTIDGKQFDFDVNTASFTASGTGSGVAASQDVSSGSSKNVVTVTASKIIVATQPTTNPVATVPLPTQPKFVAEDANNNIQSRTTNSPFNYALTVNAGSLNPTSAPANFVNGVADFTGSGFNFQGTGTNVPMSVTANSITSANTNNITCTSTTTLGTASGNMAVSPIPNNATTQAVFGFSLQTDGASTTANVTISTDVDPTTVMNTFKLYGSATNDFATASYLGITGTTTSNSVVFNSVAINSTIKYFYLVGNANSSFVTAAPSIQFSLSTSGLAVAVAGSTLTGSSIPTVYAFLDNIPPTIISVNNTQSVINETITIQTVKVIFSESMNIGFSPVPSDLIGVVNGAQNPGSWNPAIIIGWSQTNVPNDTYTFTQQHTSKLETVINNAWSWFNAPAGRNLQDLQTNKVASPSYTSTVFTIDNQKPFITSITTDLSNLNIANNTVRLTIRYNKGMDATQAPTINYSGGTLGVGAPVTGAGYTNGWKTTTNTNDTYEIDYTDNATEDAGSVNFTVNGAYDFYGNLETASGISNSFYVDRITPTISSVGRVTSTPTNATSLSYSVLFSEAMSNISTSNVTPVLIATTSGSPSPGTVTGFSGSNPVIYSVGSVVGDGDVGIDFLANGITDSHGNPLLAGLTSLANGHAEKYTVDQTPPTIKKINPISVNSYAASVNGVTNTSSLGYTVHFSEPVKGLSFSDFNGYKLPNTASVININPVSITSVNGTTYDSLWQLNASYGSGAGTFEVDFNPISNSSGVNYIPGLNGIDFLVDGGNYYAYDHQSFITGYGASASDFQNLLSGSEVYVMGGQYLGTVTSLDGQFPPRWFYFTPNNTFFGTFSNQPYTYTQPSTVISSTSGTISSVLGSNNVTGTGTSFTTQVLNNDLIFDASGTVFIGIVSNITSNNLISLKHPARATYSGSITIRRPPQTFNTTAIVDQAGSKVPQASFTGIYANFCRPEPAGPVTAFNGSPATSTTIQVNWTDVPTADHYLVMLKNSSGTFPTVADGAYFADDTDLTDGLLKWNVKQGLQTATFSGLTLGANYEFIIYPYSLDDNNIVLGDHSAIDYNITTPAKTSVGSALVHSFTYPQNIDYSTVANQKATISTTADGTQLEQFTLQDGGSSNNDQDSKNTVLETISLAFSNSQDIKQVALFDGSGSLLGGSSKPLVGGAVTFGSVGSTLISATDDGNATIKVYVTFNSTVSDHDVINVQVTSATLASTNSSAFKSGASSIPMTTLSYPDNAIEVIATKLVFTNPSTATNASLGVSYQPGGSPVQVSAEDTNNNLDIDYSGIIRALINASGATMLGTSGNTIGTSGSGIQFGTTTFSSGTFSFPTAFEFSTGSNGQDVALTLTAGAIGACNSTTILCGTTPTITLLTSFESSLVGDPTFPPFTKPTQTIPQIDYVKYQENVNIQNTSTSYELLRALLVDGSRSSSYIYNNGTTSASLNTTTDSGDGLPDDDSDGASTDLSSITIRIYKPSTLRRIALYSNGTEIPGTELDATTYNNGTGLITAATPYYDFTWSQSTSTATNPILLSAADHTEALLSVRVSFRSTSPELNDQDNIQVDLIAATLGSGSQFYNGTGPDVVNNPGPYIGGQTHTGGPGSVGIVDVIATSLDFSSSVDQPSAIAGYNPSPVGTDPVGSKAGKVTARDVVGNIDKDFVSGTITVTDGNGIAITPPSGGWVFGSFASTSPGVMDLAGMIYNSTGNGKVRVQTSNPAAVSPIPTSLDSNTPTGVSFACNSVDVINTTVEYNATGILTGNGGTYNLKGGLSGNAVFGLNFKATGSTATDPILKTFTIGFKTGPHCANNCGNNWFYSTNNGSTIIFDPTTLDVSLNGASVKANGGSVTAISSPSAGAGNYDQIKVDLTGFTYSGNPKLLTTTPLNAILYVDVSSTTSGSTPTLRPYLVDLGYNVSTGYVSVSNGSAYTIGYDAQAPVVNSPKFDGSVLPVVRYEGSIDGVEYSFASATPPILLADKNVYPTTKTSPYTAQPNVNPANPWFDPNGAIPSPGVTYLERSTSPTGSPAYPRLVLQFNTSVGVLDDPTNPSTPTGHVYDSLNNIVADLFLDITTTFLDQTNAPYVQAQAVVQNGQKLSSGTYSYLIFNLTAPGQPGVPATALKNDAVYYVNIVQGSYDQSGGTQSGISDQQLNFFGGVTDKSTLYFKTWTTTAPTATAVSSSYNVTGLGTLTATFDQLGSAYFIALKNPSTTPASISDVINHSVPCTGTITASTGSNAVVGVGTSFTTQLVVGSIIQDASGTVIGKVQSITDNLNLVLTSTASINVSAAAYTKGPENLINYFSIQNVGIPQTIQFPANSTFASGSYDVYIVTANNATPVVNSGVQVFTKAIPSVSTLPSTSFTPNYVAYNICGNSYTYLTQPMVIAEKTKGNFQKAGTQIINILLPTGYEFDTQPVYAPQVILGPSGATDFSGSATTSFASNSVMQIQFQNASATFFDVISISNLRVIGKKDPITGKLPSSGSIYWYYGNDAMTTSGNAPLKIADINVTTPIKGPDFTNSYWNYNNSVSPYHSIDPTAQNSISVKVNAIPDNYGTQVTLLPISSTFPIKPPPSGEDYLASTFSGTGVSGSVLTLAGTTLDAAFNIIMSHTDNNGCAYTKTEQYVVYKHASPISTKLGVTSNLNPATNQAFTAGTVQDIVNTNFNSGSSTANLIVPSSPIIFSDKAGYKLLELQADLPVIEIDSNKYSKHWSSHPVPQDSVGTQLMTGYAWRKKIKSLPVTTPISGGNSYSWDYSNILNASSTIVQDPVAKGLIKPISTTTTPPVLATSSINNVYDYFKQASPTNPGNYWWKGGSLGKVEFTGIYQSTADPSVYAPFRQDVELFVPSVPLIEVQGTAVYDASDISNTAAVPTFNSTQYASPAYKGTATFCEFGGQISLVAYPQASGGTSIGKFAIYDYASYNWTTNTGVPLLASAPNSAFVDNGNGTMTLDPTNASIRNSYNNVLVTYTYQDNGSPAVGVGYLVIRVTPNPVPSFTAAAVAISSPGASSLNAFCVGSQITFDASTTSTIGGVVSSSTNRDFIKNYAWDFGDPNSGNSNAPKSIDPVTIGSYLSGGPGGTAIYDGTNSSYPNNYIQPLTPASQTYDKPVHYFSTSSTYTVQLSLTSNWGCPSLPKPVVNSSYPLPSVFASSTGQIAVGQNPHPDFNVGNNCVGDPIHFFAGSSSVPPGGPAGQSINSYNWDYNQIPTSLPNPTPATQPSLPNSYGAQTIYNAPGFYNVNLTTVTTLGCQADTTKSIAQLPLQSLPLGAAYQELFDVSNGGWLALNLNTPTPSVGSTSWTYDNSAKKWTVSQNYAPNEKSALYTACLNLSTIARPVVSYDGYFNLNSGEGIVMQYSADTFNIQDPLKSWKVLGTTSDKNSPGLEWYNSLGLPSNPGVGYNNKSDNSNGYGWSYYSEGPSYAHPKHKLEDVGANSRVILRFALATVNGPLSSSTTPGFTLDSVRVGSRTRTVLFENFTSTNTGTNTALSNDITQDADSISAFVKREINNTQLVNINYHVGFVGQDPFNLLNPASPSARVLYYGVNQVPYAFLDGTHYSGTASFGKPNSNPNKDLFLNWGQGAYDLQTLKLAKADFLGLPPTPVPSIVTTNLTDGSIEVDINVTPAVALPSTTTLHVLVVEDTIMKAKVPLNQVTTGENQFEYVLRQMIPDAVGTKYPAKTFKSDTLVHLGPNGSVNPTDKFKWVAAKPLDAQKYTVVIFLQDEVTKEVYQAELFRNITPPTSTVTAVEPTAENLKVYPNPADQELTIVLPSPAKETVNIRMANQLGEFTEFGNFAEGEQTKTIKTGALSAGVYFLQIGSMNSAVRTKVIVLH